MGTQIQHAELVVIAEAGPREVRPPDVSGNWYASMNIHFKEVLKGKPELAGAKIVLRLQGDSAEARVPPEWPCVGLVFASGWEEDPGRALREAYPKPRDVEQLRVLVKVYALPTERARLLALWDLYTQGKLERRQLFDDFGQMREPANFQIVVDIYPRLDDDGRFHAIRLLGAMGDRRGLPFLLDALAAPDTRRSQKAARLLAAYFPGCPGVTEGFRKAFDREHLCYMAATYLVKRYPKDPRYRAAIERYMKSWPTIDYAGKLLDEGQKGRGTELLFEVIEDEDAKAIDRVLAARKALDVGSDLDRIRKGMLPVLKAGVLSDQYVLCDWSVELLRALHHPDCLAPLIESLSHDTKHFKYPERLREATFAIVESGPAARARATDRLLEMIQGLGRPGATRFREHPNFVNNTHVYFVALSWLGDEKAYEAAERVVAERTARFLRPVRPLMGIGSRADDGEYLLTVLQENPNLPRIATEWLVIRLGELREPKAAGLLCALFGDHTGWPIQNTLSPALIRIGGPEVIRAMTGLLRHEKHNIRREAMKVLYGVQREEMLPLLRQMLKEKDLGLKRQACEYLGRVGKLGDLDLVLPLSDFWKADRSVQGPAANAVAKIRERYDYDVNGPIRARDG